MDTYNLIYMSDLKEAIGVEDGYTLQDSKIERAIKTATTTIQKLLGRNLTKNQYTEILDSKKNYTDYYDVYGIGSTGSFSMAKQDPLALKQFPVDPDADFKVYFDLNGNFSEDTLLTSEYYTIDYELGLIWVHASVPKSKRAFKVIYTAGYDPVDDGTGDISVAPSIPEDIAQAALWQAQHYYDKGSSSNLNARYSGSQGSTNSYAYVNVAGIIPEAMAVIAMHRRPRAAVI